MESVSLVWWTGGVETKDKSSFKGNPCRWVTLLGTGNKRK